MMPAHLMPQAVAPAETRPVILERKVKNGRVLRYQLTVLQQPERARACGSGSKSATDRRPVDPPPVVELRIYDLGPDGQGYQGPADSDEDKKQIYTTEGGKRMRDITFIYNANFFLFATLELARPMAHGRVQTPAATTAPVLTGMPVSGMAYLDRPAVAGYFLFPDLSVRHEGRYTLAFSLYEETKEENDYDVDAPEVREHTFDFRMEIKSDPFTVFSAKKFPGLAESTVLSRTVAEQGVRVRIRRDVRMRRRDGKGGDDYMKADGDYPKRQTRTPERQVPEQYRQRSSSTTSDHSRTPYGPGPEMQRRPSGAEGYPVPPPPQYSQGPSGPRTANLNFEHAQVSQYPPPPQPYASAQAPPPSPTTSYPSSHPSPHPTPQPHAYRPRPTDQVSMCAAASPTIKAESGAHGHYLPPMKPESDQKASMGPSRASLETKSFPSLPSINDLLMKADRIEPDPNVTSYDPRQETAKAGSKRGRDELDEVYSFSRDRSSVQRIPNFTMTHLSQSRIDGPLGSGVAVWDNADGTERRFPENPALRNRY